MAYKQNSVGEVIDFLLSSVFRDAFESHTLDIILTFSTKEVLGPLLFNIFIIDLFLNVIKSEVCNFVDYNTLYGFDKKLDTIFSNLKYDLEQFPKSKP